MVLLSYRQQKSFPETRARPFPTSPLFILSACDLPYPTMAAQATDKLQNLDREICLALFVRPQLIKPQ